MFAARYFAASRDEFFWYRSGMFGTEQTVTRRRRFNTLVAHRTQHRLEAAAKERCPYSADVKTAAHTDATTDPA